MTIVGWVFGILFILSGLVGMPDTPALGAGFVLAGLIVTPGTWRLIEKKWGYRPHWGLRVVGAVTILFAAALMTPTDETVANVEDDDEFECLEITHPTLVELLPSTHAVRVVDFPLPPVQGNVITLGDDAWLLASPGGGLWLSYRDPTGDRGGMIFPMNERAQETEFASAGTLDAPGLQGKTVRDPEAVAALECADGGL